MFNFDFSRVLSNGSDPWSTVVKPAKSGNGMLSGLAYDTKGNVTGLSKSGVKGIGEATNTFSEGMAEQQPAQAPQQGAFAAVPPVDMDYNDRNLQSFMQMLRARSQGGGMR